MNNSYRGLDFVDINKLARDQQLRDQARASKRKLIASLKIEREQAKADEDWTTYYSLDMQIKSLEAK